MMFTWNVHPPRILSVSIKIPDLPLQDRTPVTKPDRSWLIPLTSPCFAQPHLASDPQVPVRLKGVVCHCHLLSQTSWVQILALPLPSFVI